MLAGAKDGGAAAGGGTAAANHVAEFFLAAPRCRCAVSGTGAVPSVVFVCLLCPKGGSTPLQYVPGTYLLCGFSLRCVELSKNNVVGGSNSFDEILNAVT